ncbi:MAG: c-type cytochrome [Bacteroidetes bacterium]|jgi:cytochrome c6|nr:c-type cytochrome [Bacteroidota bacterium]
MTLFRFLSIFTLVGILLMGTYCSSSETNASSENRNLSPEEKELAEGQKLYKRHCISCHGMNGKMGFNGAKDLTESNLTFNERKVLIAYGRESMMAFKSILDPEEIEAVARYSMTFSQTNE